MGFARWLARARWVLLAFLVVFFVVVVTFARLITDWLWFKELGYTTLFVQPYLWRLGIGAAAFVIAFLFIWFNVRLTKRQISQALTRYQDRVPEALSWRWISRLLILGSVVLAFLYGASIAQYWLDIAKGINGASFGTTDPILQRDVGFYVFTLPLLHIVQSFLMGLFVLVSLITAAVYFLSGSFSLDGFHLKMSPGPRVHLSLLLTGLALLKAWDYYLSTFDIMYSRRGTFFGATYTDVHAALPALQILLAISILVALTIAVNAFRPATRYILIGLGTLLFASVVVGSVYPNLIQEFIVKPNEIEKEIPFIQNHITMTRSAYGLTDVEHREFQPDSGITQASVNRNDWLKQNIRLWDWRPLLDTYAQLQELRPYYDFIDVDVDRYQIDGAYRQVMLSARELTPGKLQNKSWVNTHLQYTHGYGVVVSPVSEVSPRGLPEFVLWDIPPRGKTSLQVSRPEVYFGQQATDYVIVNTAKPEFDYPKGDENSMSFYEGKGGVPIGNYLRRLLFAARLGTSKILLSNDITGKSRVMINRTIDNRVQTLAPFLRYDGDPYLVIADGRLYWIIDAYTTSDRYPYSAPVRGWGNYVRNSVKVVVDAYNGSVDFYIADDEPVVRALSKVYPGVFKPLSAMPAPLRPHVRYPEDIFKVQSAVMLRYHMEDPHVFYNQEDVWELPREVYEQSEIGMQPYYVVIKLPEDEREEFLLMMPFTPVGKGNMVAWLAARNDGDHYGKLLLYTFSKQEVTFGPMQFEARVNQDTDISAQLTLWGQQGSRVIRGNLLIIPVGNSLVYVEPLYLQADQGRMPEFKRVIVGSGGNLVMRSSFEEALQALLANRGPTAATPEAKTPPRGAPGVSEPLPTEAAALVKKAGEVFATAQKSAASGNWEAYGKALDELSKVLTELQKVTGVK